MTEEPAAFFIPRFMDCVAGLFPTNCARKRKTQLRTVRKLTVLIAMAVIRFCRGLGNPLPSLLLAWRLGWLGSMARTNETRIIVA